MAIAFDASGTQNNVVPTNPEAWSHTTAGSDRFLATVARIVRSGLPTSTVTYNGTAMTELGSSPQDAQVNIRVAVFYLVAPDTGTNNISWSFSATPGEFSAVSTSYTGVAQSGTVEDSNGSHSSTTAPSVSLTSATNNAWFIGLLAGGGSGNPEPSGGETERVQSDAAVQIEDILKASAGAGSVNWTTASDNWSYFGIAIKEAGAGGGTTVKRSGNLLLMGVG